jgi:hypothetical protein
LGFHYSAYGLHVRTDVPLPGVPTFPAAPPDLDIHLAADSWPPDLAHSTSEGAGRGALRVARTAQHVLLSYTGGAQFAVATDGRSVYGRFEPGLTLAGATTYLLGSVMSFVLRLRAVVALHASAVLVDDGAVVVVGPSGAGKSTLTAALADAGHRILADDLVALRERIDGFQAQPGFPQVRLWPHAVEALRGASDALPQLAPPWEKCYLPLAADSFPDVAARITAVFVLGPRADEVDRPRTETLRPSAGLMSLVANIRGAEFADGGQRAHEFAVLGRLADAVPVLALHPHADIDHLGRMATLVRDQARRVAAA